MSDSLPRAVTGPVPDAPTLYLTGERTLPGVPEETYWFARHEAGYAYALAHVPVGGRVLDSGCGEGYGTARLAGGSDLAVGIDAFADTVLHAALTYPNAVFARCDAAAVPFADATFDAVVSLQVIEHLTDPAAYADECARVLAPGGTFVCATPNRLTFTPPGRPKNPFHIVEFAPDELATLLRARFTEVAVVGLYDAHPGLADALIDAAFAQTDAPSWAHEIVPTVTRDDFTIGAAGDDCLDLIAVCRR